MRRPHLLHILALILISGLLVHNIADIIKLREKLSRINRTMPFHSPGREYENLQPFLKGIHKVNYLTDRDLSPEHNDGSFLKAQYALAPIMLELGSTANTYSILDCRNYFGAMDLLKKAKAAPVHTNNFGKILATTSRP